MAVSVKLNFRAAIAAVVLAAMLAAIWLIAIYLEHDSRAALLPSPVITLFPDPKPLTAFALTDHKNEVFDLASLNGKWSFLFFGFTQCPDICPATLAILARARSTLAKSTVAADFQFVFISVDPDRDTAGKLGLYVDHFGSAFLGVTGDKAQIANLAGQLGAAYQVEATPGRNDYPVYHSPTVFLLDPRARYHAMFTPPFDAETIAGCFKVVRHLYAGNAP